MKEIKRLLFFITIISLCGFFLVPNVIFSQEETTVEQPSSTTAIEKCSGIFEIPEKIEKQVTLEEITPDNFNGISIPNTLELVSPLCLIDVGEKISYDTTQGIRITYPDLTLKKHTSFFYWDGNQKKWFSLPSIQESRNITTHYNQPFGILGVFNDLRESREGIASWYRHSKTPNGAATNYFPLGTKVKVTNLDNNKSTIVTITSTWTQKNPKRVIDIEKTGFKKIALTSQGLIRVRLEKLSDKLDAKKSQTK